MKILILNQILYTAENNIIPKVKSIKDTMIYNMCLGFKNLGYGVTLAAAQEYLPTEKEEYDFEILFFPSFLKKIFPPSVLPYSPELKDYLKKNHNLYDLVIASEVFSLSALFAAVICPYKTIIWQELTCHQNKFHKIPSKIWYNFIARFFMNKVLTVVPRSKQSLEFISKYMPYVSKTIVDHGINSEKFICSKIKKRQIISSSQLIYRKNIDGIINIYNRFHRIKGYEDVKLIIAGRGDEEIKLKKLVDELGLSDYVFFVGFLSQNELNNYIRESYCFLVNTRKDLNMVSIPEAIASGTPILTNRVPASVYYIENNKLGIAKDNWNEYDIKTLIDDNQLYVNNCINYRDKLTNEYSAKKFIEIFTTLKS